MENGSDIATPAGFNWKEWPLDERYTYRLKVVPDPIPEHNILPVYIDWGFASIDYTTPSYDDCTPFPRIDALFDLTYHSLPSKTDTELADSVNIDINYRDYPYDGYNYNYDEDDEEYLIKRKVNSFLYFSDIVIRRSDHTVDWQATFRADGYAWDFSTHYYFPYELIYLLTPVGLSIP